MIVRRWAGLVVLGCSLSISFPAFSQGEISKKLVERVEQLIADVGALNTRLDGIINNISSQAENAATRAITRELEKDSRVELFREETDAATKAARRHKQAEEAATQGQLKRIELEQDAFRAAEALTARIAEINDLIDVSEIEGKIDEAFAEPKFREAIVRRVLPVGAVVAFDREGGCPKPWVPMELASGRFLVAAGEHKNLDEHGERLSVHKLGSLGGAETHTISKPELPAVQIPVGFENGPHYIGFNSQEGAGYALKFERRNDNAQDNGQNMGTGRSEFVTDPLGEGKAHNNMPPYIALYFCKKEAG